MLHRHISDAVLAAAARADWIAENPIKRIGTTSPNKLGDLIAALGYVIGADCKPE